MLNPVLTFVKLVDVWGSSICPQVWPMKKHDISDLISSPGDSAHSMCNLGRQIQFSRDTLGTLSNKTSIMY